MTHVTRAECDAALDHILAAPKEAEAELLCFRTGFSQRDFRDEIELSVKRGIIGERWENGAWLKLEDGSPDPRIQVSILQRRVLDLFWRNRDEVIHPGDTIIADMDLGEANLPVGQRLQAGTAVLEVSSKFNNACAKWKVRYGRESFDWINEPDNIQHRLRGALCMIVQDGVIKRGDQLTKL